MRLPLAAAVLLGSALPLRADDTLPADALRAVKAATVFIKIEFGAESGSGSGFLIRAEGDTGLVATNQHVAAPEPDEPASPFAGPPLPGMPRRPFGPSLPRPPIGPRLMPRGGLAARSQVKLTAVFDSGTPRERSAPAEVLLADKERDLALLRVRGIKDLPAPLEWRDAPAPAELQAVYVFGFPFGDDLAVGKGNPSVTVGKASVTSLRLNDARELARVQIEGEVHPGNSGGPVVDSQGRLVGVTVAKVKGTRIGLAVATEQLRGLVKPKLLGARFTRRAGAGDAAEIDVSVSLVNALGTLKGVRLVYALAGGGPAAAQDLLAGPGRQVIDLTPGPTEAAGRITLPAAGGDPALAWQVVAEWDGGATERTPPAVQRLTTPRPTAPAVVGPARPPVLRSLGAEELTRLLGDLASDDPAKVGPALDELAAAAPGERAAEVVAAENGWPRATSARASRRRRWCGAGPGPRRWRN
jgi:S1-C subfamily serine protease